MWYAFCSADISRGLASAAAACIGGAVSLALLDVTFGVTGGGSSAVFLAGEKSESRLESWRVADATFSVFLTENAPAGLASTLSSSPRSSACLQST